MNCNSAALMSLKHCGLEDPIDPQSVSEEIVLNVTKWNVFITQKCGCYWKFIYMNYES